MDRAQQLLGVDVVELLDLCRLSAETQQGGDSMMVDEVLHCLSSALLFLARTAREVGHLPEFLIGVDAAEAGHAA